MVVVEASVVYVGGGCGIYYFPCAFTGVVCLDRKSWAGCEFLLGLFS